VGRFLAAVSVLLLAACGGSSGGGLNIGGGPPSAQTVAANDADWSGLQKCPESGSYDSYLKAEKDKSPDQYQTDKTNWDDLKAAGANDSYVAVYADEASRCGQFGVATPGGTPGKIVYVYAFRFKDASSAGSNYKANAKDFHLSDSEVSQLKAAGATVKDGKDTGLSDNAIELTIAAEGASVFVAFWQNKSFEVAMVTLNEDAAGAQAASKINGRIQ
jgi:hypothetical protein